MSNDFIQFFWEIGRAVLEGRNPYTITGNVYPPITSLFFVIFAIFPKQTSFILWLIFNLIIIAFFLGKKKPFIKNLIWIGYTPLLFTLIAGQLEIFFLWIYSYVCQDDQNSWMQVIAASLLTLKPQIALILLPWVVIKWIKLERRKLFRWIILCFSLHGFPFLISPELYVQWWQSGSRVTAQYMTNSPGVFSLTSIGVPVYVLAPIATLIFFIGFKYFRVGSLQANILSIPYGTWYNSTLLVNSAPWQLLIPVSWVALFLSYQCKATYFFLLVSLFAFLWTIINQERKKINNTMSAGDKGV